MAVEKKKNRPVTSLKLISDTSSIKMKGGTVSKTTKQKLHPIDQRLAEMGKSRNWLGQQVGRSTSCIKGYCDRKVIIKPGSVVCKRICQVLEIDLNFLYLGQRSTTQLYT